jgi:hypothetical protein
MTLKTFSIPQRRHSGRNVGTSFDSPFVQGLGVIITRAARIGASQQLFLIMCERLKFKWEWVEMKEPKTIQFQVDFTERRK